MLKVMNLNCRLYPLKVREDTHKKKVFFLVVGPLRIYPPPLMV